MEHYASRLDAVACGRRRGLASGEALTAVSALVNSLRRIGVSAECDLMGRSLKAQMKYAGKNARFTVVVGQSELESGEASIKDMATGETRACPLTADAIAAAVNMISPEA